MRMEKEMEKGMEKGMGPLGPPPSCAAWWFARTMTTRQAFPMGLRPSCGCFPLAILASVSRAPLFACPAHADANFLALCSA